MNRDYSSILMTPTTPTQSKRLSEKSISATRPLRRVSKKTVKNTCEISNYTTACRWLYEHVNHERLRVVSYNNRTFSLDRVRKLLGRLGNPHQATKFVHVAGTKGKGSTCAMVSSILKASGYTVGLYTSPHLVDLRERIAIDGRMISHSDLAEIFKLIAAEESKLPGGPPTFYEIMTVAAIRYFADQAVDIAVLETGLGGRLDATNVVSPLVCGITRISMDHTNILGQELGTIAAEKAGIFKPNVPALSVIQDPEVAKSLEEVAQKSDTLLEYTGSGVDFSYRFQVSRELGPHTRVCITTPTSRWEHLPVPLRGEHQAHNCGLALSILDKLKGCGFNIPDEKVISGLAATTLAGRMERVWNQPHIVVDGAHNAASIQALIKALGAYIAYDSLVMIFGCGQDKEIDPMLKQVSLGADKIIFTRAKANPRAMEPEDLQSRFCELSTKMTQIAPNLDEAFELANRAVSREDLIIVTGSFYLAGEAKKMFADRLSKLGQ